MSTNWSGATTTDYYEDTICLWVCCSNARTVGQVRQQYLYTGRKWHPFHRCKCRWQGRRYYTEQYLSFHILNIDALRLGSDHYIHRFNTAFYGGSGITTGIFGEVNGDGLPDYEANAPGYLVSAYLGNGVAWDATTRIFSAPKEFPTTVPTATASQLIDINGDGLDDWAYSD